jgi:hypothetical protein
VKSFAELPHGTEAATQHRDRRLDFGPPEGFPSVALDPNILEMGQEE